MKFWMVKCNNPQLKAYLLSINTNPRQLGGEELL